MLFRSGVDALYIGPADLSITYGLEPKTDQDDPEWNAALARVVDACNVNGVIPAVHADASLTAKRAAVGFRMITVGFDFSNVMMGIRADLAKARAGLPEV